MGKKGRFLSAGKGLLFLTALFSLLGILFVFEASMAEAFYRFNDPYFFLRQQAVWLLIGWLALIAASFLPINFWQKISAPTYLLNLLLLLLVFVPGLGREINGAHRWFVLGPLTLQPVEISKLAFVLFFANWMNRHQRLLPFLFLTLLPISLLLLQPDLGSSLIILAIVFGIFFLAGGHLKTLLTLGLLGGIGILFLILLQPYRLRRLTTFLNPESDPLGASFHIRQITLALGNGGWWGRGIGHSKQKFAYIPEASTDSIMAIIAEEIGFVGSSFLLILYMLYVYLAYRVFSKQPPGSFGSLLAGGILIWFVSQTLLNLSAVVALVPLTGLPLPFLSYGGSSLVMILLITGILISLNRQTAKSK